MKALEIKASDYLTPDKGKGIQLQLSTYDVPRRANVKFDKGTGVLGIGFEYIDNEPVKTQRLDARIVVCIGEYSGKILGFDISVEKHSIKEVLIIASQAITREIPKLARYNQKANYSFVKRVLDRNLEPLEAAAGR